MEPYTCTRPFYLDESDKEQFITGYMGWKEEHINCKEIFTKAVVEKVVSEYGDTQHHTTLGLREVMSNVFYRLKKDYKRNVAEVCKAWARLFLVGTETSKVLVDYNRQLVTENVEGLITAQRGQKVVQMYCICRAFGNEEDNYEFHRQLENGWSSEEDMELATMGGLMTTREVRGTMTPTVTFLAITCC